MKFQGCMDNNGRKRGPWAGLCCLPIAAHCWQMWPAACRPMLPALGKPWLLTTENRKLTASGVKQRNTSTDYEVVLWPDHLPKAQTSSFSPLGVLDVSCDGMIASDEFPFAPLFVPTGKPSHMNPSMSPGLRYFQSIWGKSYVADLSSKHMRQRTNKI